MLMSNLKILLEDLVAKVDSGDPEEEEVQGDQEDQKICLKVLRNLSIWEWE